MGIEGEKAKKDYQHLGADVTVTTEALEGDKWAQATLRDIGKTMSEPGFKYLGSACVHYYGNESSLVTTVTQAQMKHQLALGEVPESIAVFGIQEFLKRIEAFFGKEKRSIDPRYIKKGNL